MSDNRIKWLWPVKDTNVGDVTKERWYTGPHGQNLHSGIDVCVPGIEGYDVVASRKGKVVKILSGCNSYSGLSEYGRDCSQSGCVNEIKSYGSDGYYCNDTVGNAVFLEHEFKNSDGSTYYLYSQYCHLKTIDVSMNQAVNQGVKIGTVGSTGMSTGPHLHFSISTGLSYWGGTRINNNPYNVNDVKNSDVDKTGYVANEEIEYFDTPEPEEPAEIKVPVIFKKNTQSDRGPVVETREYVVGKKYGSFPAVSREGYTFDGWWPEHNIKTNRYTENSIVPAWGHTLYAHWNEIITTAKIDLCLNYTSSDNTLHMNDLEYTVGSTAGLGVNDPVRKGYKFNGWYTARSGGTKVSTFAQIPTGTNVLYARWTKMITVKFNLNYTPTNGAVAPSDVTFPEDNKPAKLPSFGDRFGYKFGGWSITAGNSNQNGKVINYNSVTDSKTLYAIWEVKTMEVTYNYNINNKISKKSTETYGVKYGTDVPTKPEMNDLGSENGHDFKGWYHDEVKEDSTVKMDSNHTLTAMWEPKKLTVSFDAGDGEFAEPVDPIIVVYGDTYGGLPVPKSKNFWEFNYWSIVDDAGVNHGKCTKDTKVLQKYNHTMRAVWKKKRTVSFILPGESVATKWLSKQYGSKYGLPPVVNREGYRVKWYFYDEESPYNGMEYSTEMIVHPDHPATVKGMYEINDITLTIDYTAGFATTNPAVVTKTVHIGDRYELPDNITCNEDYLFNGWELIDENGQFLGMVENGDEIQIGKNHTVAASWCENAIVYLYGDEMKDELLHVFNLVKYGQTYRFLEDFKVEGFDINGWFFIGGGQRYHGKGCKLTDRVIPEHPNDLYVVMSPKKTNVIYSADGGVYETEPEKITYDGDAVVEHSYGDVYSSLIPNKETGVFTGWFYDRECTVPVQEDDRVIITEPHTIYAGWEKHPIVTFSAGADTTFTDAVPSKIVHTGEPYGELPTPKSADLYRFYCWMLIDENGDPVDFVLPDTVVTLDTDHTVEAAWEKIATIYFNTDGGSSVTSKFAGFGEPYPILPIPTKEGYTFVHWVFEGGARDGQVCIARSDDMLVMPDDSSLLKAVWEPVEVD